jgi:hypothetical protein
MVTLYDQFVLPITALPPHWFDRCDASADFAEHSHNWLRQLPWNLPGNLTVSRQFADYWLAEADGASPDYDATTGDWIDAVGGGMKKPRRSNQWGGKASAQFQRNENCTKKNCTKISADSSRFGSLSYSFHHWLQNVS